MLMLIGCLNLAFIIIPTAILIALIFPTSPIFGYWHTVPSFPGSDKHVSISPLPLYQVLSDDIYSSSLKAGYISIVVFEVLAVICILILLITFLLGKEKASLWMFGICYFVSSLLCILIMPYFSDYPTVLGLSIGFLVFFILSVATQITIKLIRKRQGLGDSI